MSDKFYNLGVVCGRFGHEHLGHMILFDSSMALCKKTLILVGSAQESKTLRNPFTIDTRILVIKNTYPDEFGKSLSVKGIDDLTNEYDITSKWGSYVKKHIEQYENRFADLMVYGNDEERNRWFDPNDLINTAELIVPRKVNPISATNLRGYLTINDKDNWKKVTSSKIHDMYDYLRDELLSCDIYKKIYDELKQTDLSIDNYLSIYKKYEELDKIEKLKKIK